MKSLSRLALFWLILGFSQPGAQDIQFVGSALWSGTQDVKVVGTVAYGAFTCGLQILDISDPSNPIIYSRLFCPGEGCALEISGHYAYLADGTGGLRIIDVSDIFNPRLTGQFDTPDSSVDIVTRGIYAYMIDDSLGLYIIDISTPQSPTQVGHRMLSNNRHAGSISILGNYAYIGSRDRSRYTCLHIIDISNPAEPRVTAIVNYSQQISVAGVAVMGNYAYIAAMAGYYHGVLLSYDISDRSAPQLLGNYAIDSVFTSISIADDFLYTAGYHNLCVWSLADSSTPSLISCASDTFAMKSICLNDNRAYLASDLGFETYDLSDSDDPLYLGGYREPPSFQHIAISGNYAYLTSRLPGSLRVVDIINPGNPSLISRLDLGYQPGLIMIAGDYAYISSVDTIKIFNVSDPHNPMEAGQFEPGRGISDIFVNGSYFYIEVYDGGLEIYSIENPSSPVYTGSLHDDRLRQGVSQIFVAGGYDYMAGTRQFSLGIVDVHNPAAPQMLGTYSTGMNAASVCVIGNLAYLTSGGLWIFDISNPNSPQLLGASPVNQYEWEYGLFVSGNYAFTNSYLGNLNLYDVSSPADPHMVATTRYPGDLGEITGIGEYCYLGNEYGMNIYNVVATGISDNIETPKDYFLFDNFPNPFNSSTTIRYAFRHDGEVQLTIYNLLGQKIAILLDEYQKAGEHSIAWNGAGLQSGIYYARLQTSETVRTLNMLLVK